MKTLHLTLKKKWFDMILSGEKKEEYREIKPYWIKRLISDSFNWDCATCNDRNVHYAACPNEFYKKYTTVLFKNGYSKKAPSMEVELLNISRGVPNSNWINETNDYVFILKLGAIIKTDNL